MPATFSGTFILLPPSSRELFGSPGPLPPVPVTTSRATPLVETSCAEYARPMQAGDKFCVGVSGFVRRPDPIRAKLRIDQAIRRVPGKTAKRADPGSSPLAGWSGYGRSRDRSGNADQCDCRLSERLSAILIMNKRVASRIGFPPYDPVEGRVPRTPSLLISNNKRAVRRVSRRVADAQVR